MKATKNRCKNPPYVFTQQDTNTCSLLSVEIQRNNFGICRALLLNGYTRSTLSPSKRTNCHQHADSRSDDNIFIERHLTKQNLPPPFPCSRGPWQWKRPPGCWLRQSPGHTVHVIKVSRVRHTHHVTQQRNHSKCGI